MRKAWPNSSSSRSAFTLVEILVVIAIIALLAAILFPAFARARESGRQSTCATNLQQISIAVQQYFQDERRYPDSLVDLLPEGSKFDDGSTDGSGKIPDNVTGYLKNGSEDLVCPNDDLDSPIPHSSYGSLNKIVPPKPTTAPSLEGADADPNVPAGTWAYNYWGYDPDGFAFPTASDVAQASPPPVALLYPQVSRSGSTTPLQGVFNHPLMGSTYDSSQRPNRNVLRYSLANRFAPPSTIVTHCVFHRVQTGNNLTAAGQLGYSGSNIDSSNARDIVLRLDGSAKAVDVSQWKTQTDPNGLDKWQSQTP